MTSFNQKQKNQDILKKNFPDLKNDDVTLWGMGGVKILALKKLIETKNCFKQV